MCNVAVSMKFSDSTRQVCLQFYNVEHHIQALAAVGQTEPRKARQGALGRPARL